MVLTFQLLFVATGLKSKNSEKEKKSENAMNDAREREVSLKGRKRARNATQAKGKEGGVVIMVLDECFTLGRATAAIYSAKLR